MCDVPEVGVMCATRVCVHVWHVCVHVCMCTFHMRTYVCMSVGEKKRRGCTGIRNDSSPIKRKESMYGINVKVCLPCNPGVLRHFQKGKLSK